MGGDNYSLFTRDGDLTPRKKTVKTIRQIVI